MKVTKVLTHYSKQNIPRCQHHLLPGGAVVDAHVAFIRTVVGDPHLWESGEHKTRWRLAQTVVNSSVESTAACIGSM